MAVASRMSAVFRPLCRLAAAALLAAGVLGADASQAQVPMALFRSFEGRVGYAQAAGTFRTEANTGNACAVGTTSAIAVAGIPAGATVEAAYVYWAGSGAADNSVTLDGAAVTASRTFADQIVFNGNTSIFFQGFADATAAVTAKRNASYTLGGLTTATGTPYTTFSNCVRAWSMTVIYRDAALVRRARINVYDGLRISVSGVAGLASTTPITVDRFETPAANASTLGVVFWEGDPGIGAPAEALSFAPAGGATTVLDDTDPLDSVFRLVGGTNGSATQYGVDLDIYTVSGSLPTGTNAATLTLTSGGDLVLESQAVLAMQSLGSDLALALAVSNATPGIGGTTTVTATLSNLGPDASELDRVAFTIPAGYTFVSATPPAGTTYDAATATWTLSTGLAVGASLQFPLVLRATIDAPVSVTGTATTSFRAEDNLANNTATVAIDARPVADLSVGVSASNPTPAIGSTVTFTVTASNAGPTDATSVALSTLLGGNLTFVSATTATGTISPTTGAWALGSLASGASATATITAIVTGPVPGTLTSEVTASGQPDPDSTPANGVTTEDDYARATVTPPAIDLALAMTVSNATPTAGQTVTFTTTVTNQSLLAATGVEILVPFRTRAGVVTVTSSTPGVGTYDGTTWVVGALAPGASVTLTVQVRVDLDRTAQTASAEVARAGQPDVDSTPGNGVTSEDDYAAATVTTGGSTSAGLGGLESNGSLAQALGRVLYTRREARAARGGAAEALVPWAEARAARAEAGKTARLAALVPEAGPEASRAVEVSPEDLLPVTNARDIVAADYLRADGVRVGALFATETAAGEVYEHTKAVCDRLRGGVLEGVETVMAAGHPLVLSRLGQAGGQTDYAISFVAYGPSAARTVDSRFLLAEYDTTAMRGDAPVVNVQVWGPSREHAVALAEAVLARLAADGALSFRADVTGAPALPAVFVRSARYDAGRLVLDVFNAAGATELRLTGSTAARTEGGGRVGIDQTVPLRAGTPAEPLVVATVATGPLFDAAFFVHTDRSTAADRLYLADGVWGVALGDAADRVADFEVAAEGRTPAPGRRLVERAARVSGTTASLATLYRTLAPGGIPVDLADYGYLEFAAAGDGPVQVVLQQAEIATADHYRATVTLTPDVRTHRVWFRDLRRDGGARAFSGRGVVAVTFTARHGGAAAPFAIAVRDLAFGGGAGDAAEVAATALLAPAPNPATTSTDLRFELAQAGPARLAVYDLLGREVAVVASGEHAAGRHVVTFRPTAMATGIYVVVLDADGQRFSRRLTVLR